MVILQLDIAHFGKHADRTITLRPGMNVITGGNSSGKSTIAAFIRAMLYGFDAEDRAYERFYPREDNGIYGGKMKILADGLFYEISRDLVRGRESLTVTRTSDGTAVENPQEWLSRMCGDLDDAFYESSGFISQDALEADAEALRRAEQPTEEEQAQLALKRIADKAADEVRAKRDRFAAILPEDSFEAMQKNLQHIDTLESEREALRAELPGIEQELSQYVGDLEKDENRIRTENRSTEDKYREEIVKSKQALENNIREVRRAAKRTNVPAVILMVVAGLLAIATYFYVCSYKLDGGDPNVYRNMLIGFGAAGALFLGGLAAAITYAALKRKDKKRIEAQQAIREAAEKAETDYQHYLDHRTELEAKVDHLESRSSRIEALETELGSKRTELQEMEQELTQCREKDEAYAESETRRDRCLLEINACDAAIEALNIRIENAAASCDEELSDRATLYFSGIETSCDDQLLVDERGIVSVTDGLTKQALSTVSTGIRREALLSLRLARLEKADPRKCLPLVLDDVLANFDTDRMNSAMNVFRSLGRQVILFSCQSRERQNL